MRLINTVVAMVARCRVNSVNVQTKVTAVTGAQLCQDSTCLPWQCLFGCSNERLSAIMHFLRDAGNGSSDRILVDAADGGLVACVVEWLFGEGFLDCRFKSADQ